MRFANHKTKPRVPWGYKKRGRFRVLFTCQLLLHAKVIRGNRLLVKVGRAYGVFGVPPPLSSDLVSGFTTAAIGSAMTERVTCCLKVNVIHANAEACRIGLLTCAAHGPAGPKRSHVSV